MVAPIDSIEQAGTHTTEIVHVGSLAQLEELRMAAGACVIDFYADWCGPCKAIASQYAVLAAQFPGVTFAKVNVDMVQDPDITSLPTFQIWENGSLKGHTVGARIDVLKKTIADALQGGAERYATRERMHAV